MTMHSASSAGPCSEQAQQAPIHHDLFTDAHQVGVLDYLCTYQHVPLTTLDIDRFIYTIITNPAHPHVWNAGYLAGWLAGMASVEGSTEYVVAQIHHEERAGTHLHLVEVGRS